MRVLRLCALMLCACLFCTISQAPIVSADCQFDLASSEVLGMPWCALWFGTLGLSKLDCSGNGSSTAQQCSGALLHHVGVWLIVDLQTRVFSYRNYAPLVVAWRDAFDARSEMCAAHDAWRDAQIRQLCARRLAAWRIMQSHKLGQVTKRLRLIRDSIISKPRGAQQPLERHCYESCAASSSPLGSSSASAAGSDAAAAARLEHPSSLEEVALCRTDEIDASLLTLTAAGFDGQLAAIALIACSAGGKRVQETLGAATRYASLTLLLSVELGLQPKSALRLSKVARYGSCRRVPATSVTHELLDKARRAEGVDLDTEPSVGGEDERGQVQSETGAGERSPAHAKSPPSGGLAPFEMCKRLNGWRQHALRCLYGHLRDHRDPVLFADATELTASPVQSVRESASSYRRFYLNDESTSQRTPQASYATNRKEMGFGTLGALALQVLCSCTFEVVVASMLINHAVNANLLSLVFPLSVFLYAALDSPRPAAWFFDAMSCYTFVLIAAKFAVQLPLVCGSPPFTLRSTNPVTHNATCFDADAVQSASFFRATLPQRVDYVVGLHKFTRHSSLANAGTLLGLLPDLCTLLLLITHRQVARARGSEGRVHGEGSSPADDASSGPITTTRSFLIRLLPPLAFPKNGTDVHISTALVSLVLLVYSIPFFSSLKPEVQGCNSAAGLQDQFTNDQIDTPVTTAVVVFVSILVLDRVIYRRWEPPQVISSAGAHDGPGQVSNHISPEMSEQGVPGQSDASRPTEAPVTGSCGGCSSLPPLALALKLMLHVILTVAVHAVTFFYLPSWHCTARDCEDGDVSGATHGLGGWHCRRSGSVIVFYLLNCVYLWLSAKQLRLGFPLVVLEHPLTDNASKYALYVHNYVFMALPFLWEARVALDWTFTPETSLSLVMWLKLEDIYSGLCSVRSVMTARREFTRGARQPAVTKCCMGSIIVAAIFAITAGPLFLFSPTSPIQHSNPVTQASAGLYVFIAHSNAGSNSAHGVEDGRTGPLGGKVELGTIRRFELTDHIDPSGNNYGLLAADWYQLRLAAAAQNQWLVNNATLSALCDALGTNTSVTIGITLQIERAELEPVTVPAWRGNVTGAVRAQMRAVCDVSRAFETLRILTDGRWPSRLRLPSVRAGPPRHSVLQQAKLQFAFVRSASGTAPQQWWAVENTSAVNTSSDAGLLTMIASDRLASDQLAGSLGIPATGLGALYAFLFIGAFRTVRAFTAGSRYRLTLDEMPDTRDLVDLCDSVYIARRQSNLVLETDLMEMIIRVFRSPEALLALTGGELKHD